MGANKLLTLACAFVIVEVTQGQCYGRMRNMPRDHHHQGCSCDELLSFIARNYEEHPTPPQTYHSPSPSNFEEVIMKLVNALVYTTTTQATHNTNCHHSHSDGPNNSGGSYHPGGSNNNGQSGSGGLIDLDLLNPDRSDNILDLNLGREQLLGLGLGGRGNDRGSSQGRNSNSGDGLINLELLNGGKNNNVAELSLGNQNVLGVGLGGGGSNSSQNSKGNGRNDGNRNGEGSINLDLLDPNKKSNVLDLDLGKQNVLGLGLGN